MMRLNALGLLTLLIYSTGCAYPQKVKDAATAQGVLIEKIKQTADDVGSDRVEALGRSGRLAFEGAVAGECSVLLEDGCGRGGCLAKQVGAQLSSAGSDEAEPFRAAAIKAVGQNEALDEQLAFMRRAQETIAEYVGIDVTIGEDKLKSLDEAAKALDDANAPADKKPAGADTGSPQ